MGNLNDTYEHENETIESKVDESKLDESKLDDLEYLAQLYEQDMAQENHEFYSLDPSNENNKDELKTDEIKTDTHTTITTFPFESLSRKNKNSIHINGLTRNEIERYLEHGGIGVTRQGSHSRIINGRAMCKQGYVKQIKWNDILFKDGALSKVLIKTEVQSETDPNSTYVVKIFLADCETIKKQKNTFIITITDSKQIQQTHCTCDDTYGDLDNHRKKCKHISATFEGIHHPYIRNGRVSSAKSSYERNINLQNMERSFYKIADCKIPLGKVPLTFPGPTDAFNFENAAPIIKWLSDPDPRKSNLAAILVWMYCDNGAINSVAPKCKYHDMNCNKKYMTFDVDALEWHCYGYHVEYNQETNKFVKVQHKDKMHLLAGSEFFQFLKPRQIGIFTKFFIYFIDNYTSVKSAMELCGGIKSLTTAYKWALVARNFFGVARKRIVRKLGSNGSSLEMDGTHFGQKWKYFKMRMPLFWHSRMWWRVGERNWTPKERHRRFTFIVGAESVEQCLELTVACCAKNRELLMFGDGCGFGDSNAIKLLYEHFEVSQCSHDDDMMVKIGTEHLDAHHKSHENTMEASFQRDKLNCSSHYGLGGLDVHRAQSWMWESDWRNNETDMSTVDCVQTFVQQVCQIYPAKLPSMMN
eukprot:162807_1